MARATRSGTSGSRWQPSILSGLLQTEDYARAILATEPGVADDDVAARLTARLARQATLTQDDPPAAWFLMDEAAVAGQVFEDTEIIAGLLIRFDTLRNEALRGSENPPAVTIVVSASSPVGPRRCATSADGEQ